MTIFSHLSYLEKHRFLPRQINQAPASGLERVIVIPAYDEPRLISTLESLEACDPASGETEVIVVLNSGNLSTDQARLKQEKAAEEWHKWKAQGPKSLSHHLLSLDPLPRKHAGVGLARKIGMDEAVDRLLQAATPKGLIIGLDADCEVSQNYLRVLAKAPRQFPKAEAFSLDFEHPLEGNDYSEKVYRAILGYELYLRHFIEALRWAGHPHAYHCIGSSMAVRADAYQARGGMNRRKAGEDFYFLQKFIQEGTLTELHGTLVKPAPRPSHRVPFGTGKAVQQLLDQYGGQSTFAWESFAWLQSFIAKIPSWYETDPEPDTHPLALYLEEMGWRDRIKEIRPQVRSESAFIKRFFKWFNGLRVLQFLHYSRDYQWANVPIETGCSQLFQARGWPLGDQMPAKEMLAFLRSHEQG